MFFFWVKLEVLRHCNGSASRSEIIVQSIICFCLRVFEDSVDASLSVWTLGSCSDSFASQMQCESHNKLHFSASSDAIVSANSTTI